MNNPEVQHALLMIELEQVFARRLQQERADRVLAQYCARRSEEKRLLRERATTDHERVGTAPSNGTDFLHPFQSGESGVKVEGWVHKHW